MGALYVAAGIDQPALHDLSREDEARLVRALSLAAQAFREGGGVVSLHEWAGLDRIERAAFVRAGRVLATGDATRIGLAAQGPDGLAEVLAPVDGGASRTRRALARAAATWLEERSPF